MSDNGHLGTAAGRAEPSRAGGLGSGTPGAPAGAAEPRRPFQARSRVRKEHQAWGAGQAAEPESGCRGRSPIGPRAGHGDDLRDKEVARSGRLQATGLGGGSGARARRAAGPAPAGALARVRGVHEICPRFLPFCSGARGRQGHYFAAANCWSWEKLVVGCGPRGGALGADTVSSRLTPRPVGSPAACEALSVPP